MSKMYDSKCYDLAEEFLSDEPTINDKRHIDALAVLIQQTIEDYIGAELVQEEHKS